MPWNSRIKLEPRGDEDPKFNIKNKTDRKIFFGVLIFVIVGILVIAGLIAVYFIFFK